MFSDNYEKQTLPDHYLEKKIIIIGAGMSGLTCAEYLEKLGFRNVKILEASSRIGGRLHTCHSGPPVHASGKSFGENFLELGSQRVQECSSVYKIVQKNKQILKFAPDYNKALENISLVANSYTDYSAILSLRRYFVYRTFLPKDFDDILRDEEFSKIFENCERCFIKALKYHMKGVYHWWYGLAYEYTFENKQRELGFGQSGILQTILKRLSPDAIHPNKEVVTIDWTDLNSENSGKDSPKIKIKCLDDSTYKADHVIIAIPLGYLKKNYKTLFIPSLPEDKINAMNNLNFITINKIFLEFSNPFWKPSDVYHVIWNEKMDNLFNDFKHKNGKDPTEWIRYINRFEYVYTNRKFLCAWIWGKGAIIMESLPEEEITKCCIILLQYLTRKSLPKPIKMIRTQWNSDRLFRGSVVYDPSQPIYHLLKKMSESICVKGQPILQFTGDVADMDIVSSVHGARESGTRAAKELYMHCATQACIPLEDRVLNFNLD